MLVGLMSTMSGREAAAQANNKKLRGLPAGTLKYCAVHMNPVSGVADHRLCMVKLMRLARENPNGKAPTDPRVKSDLSECKCDTI